MLERFKNMPTGPKIFFGAWLVLAIGVIIGAFGADTGEATGDNDNNQLGTENNRLRAENSALQKEVDELRAGGGGGGDDRVEELEGVRDTLQSDKVELEEQLEEARGERDKLQAQVEDRDGKIDELQSQIEGLQTKNSDLVDQVEELESQASQQSQDAQEDEAASPNSKHIEVVISSDIPVDVMIMSDDLQANAQETITGEKVWEWDVSKDSGLLASASNFDQSGSVSIQVFEDGELVAESMDSSYAQVIY